MTPAEQVKLWADAYYNGTPIVDDVIYDAFCKANNLEAGLQGDELKGNREPKYKHSLTTGTLAKAEDLEDERFDKWQKRIVNEAVNISMKVDGCVSADTKIVTEFGEKTIKEVVENPEIKQVLSYNESLGCTEMRNILDKKTGFNDKKWYKVTTKSGRVLHITEDDHLYLKQGCYREVKDLIVGDQVLINA